MKRGERERRGRKMEKGRKRRGKIISNSCTVHLLFIHKYNKV